MDPQRSAARARQFFEVYTKDLTASDLQRLFTRDAREAYAFFSRGVDRTAVDRLPWYRRFAVDIKLFFLAFSMRLSPARRVIFGVAFFATPDRLLQHVDGHRQRRSPRPLPAADRVRPAEPPDRPGSRRSPVAQARPEHRPRHTTRDAAPWYVSRARPGDPRPDEARQHGRRRLLRPAADAGRAGAGGAGRRGRQGQPGGAADGAARWPFCGRWSTSAWISRR